MNKKQIINCDGCGKKLKHTSEIYYLYLKTDRFWKEVNSSYYGEKLKFGREVYNVEELHFCKECAKDLKNTLQKILTKCKKEES